MFRKVVLIVICVLFVGCAISKAPERSASEEAQIERKLQLLLEQSVKSMRIGTPSAFDQAFATLSVAQELKPLDARVLDGFGSLAWRRGDQQTAKWYFQKAIEHDSHYSRPYVHLALVAVRDGKPKAAHGLLQKAIELNPLNYRARNDFAALAIDNRHNAMTDAGRDFSTPYLDALKVLALQSPEDPVIAHNLELLSVELTQESE